MSGSAGRAPGIHTKCTSLPFRYFHPEGGLPFCPPPAAFSPVRALVPAVTPLVCGPPPRKRPHAATCWSRPYRKEAARPCAGVAAHAHWEKARGLSVPHSAPPRPKIRGKGGMGKMSPTESRPEELAGRVSHFSGLPVCALCAGPLSLTLYPRRRWEGGGTRASLGL